MNTRAVLKMTLCSGLLAVMASLGPECFAQPQGRDEPPVAATTASVSDPGTETTPSGSSKSVSSVESAQAKADEFTETRLGLSLLKNIAMDQKAIWTSPSSLRWADGSWLFPLAAVTAGLFATDRAVPPVLSTDQKTLNRYTSFSNYGVYSLVGAGGGLYLWSTLSHDDHQRETGILVGEAAIDSLAVGNALKYSFERERPNQGQGLGNFFHGGVSFPSEHSEVAWSIASVIAHEYPGPLTKLVVYGLAAAVSASSVAGKQHFPSDVVVGGAMGWLVGWQVFRAHHDPELGGAETGSLSDNLDGEDGPDRHKMGSPSVPLDSWVYSAFERLAALRAINTQIMGQKPWTRFECARLTDEAGERLRDGQISNSEEAARIQTRLAQEFTYEISLLGGGHNLTANLESVYARAVSISGPALTDSYHFGQTISYDFGRPFERGTNGQAGGSFSAAAGPLALYVRAEYQHAPSAPAPSYAAVSTMANQDGVPISSVPSGPITEINRIELLDTYVSANLNNWQLILGRQSLSWAPGPEGSMIWSNNIEPVDMARLVNSEPFRLPGFLSFLGPVRIDQFFGRLAGHPYVPRPFVYGQKINVKPFPFLELGFGRRSMIGGTGSSSPLTASNLIHNFFGMAVGGTASGPGSVPGDSDTEMDWTFYVPKVRNYIVLYGDAYAEDDILPIENPARNPWHSGIYLTRFPGISKLDFHMEGVSTEQAGRIALAGGGNFGQFNYWNQSYPDGNTNLGNLIGNTVGRDGQTIQGWLTYWMSPTNTLQARYGHTTVSADFVPGGAAWQDYSVQSETHLRNGFYAKCQLQYENISRYPILFTGPQRNFTAIIEVGFSPKEKEMK